jgi:hypothetical protein
MILFSAAGVGGSATETFMSKKPQAETSKGQEKDQEKQEKAQARKAEKIKELDDQIDGEIDKVEKPRVPQKVRAGVFCQHCAHRNNTESDKRGPNERGGSGWCDSHLQFVARKRPAEKCNEFKKRDTVQKQRAQDQQSVDPETPKEVPPNALCKTCKHLQEKDGESSSGYCDAKGCFVGGLGVPVLCEHYVGPKPKFVTEREKAEKEMAEWKERQEKREKKAMKEEPDHHAWDRDAVEEKADG